MHRIRRRQVGAMTAAAVLVLAAACGGGSDEGPQNSDGSVTLTWWHNGTTDPARSTWKQLADAYTAANPDVKFKIEPIQNEQFQTKVPLALQGSDPPEIYQQWGGGALATQIQSGKVMDITDATADWIGDIGNAAKGWQVDGKQYGVPFDLHTVGFWYRTDLFAQAGITEPPTTMDDLNVAVEKLKNADITPIAVGGKDKWPDAFYWSYFALRECSGDTISQAVEDLSMDDECFIKAGEDLGAFLETEPFQTGFLGTPAQQGAGSSAGMVANGKAAMELQGDWELAVMPGLTTDKDLTSKLGWFPFPTVDGGAGEANAALGGGDGYSCTIEATDACADFLGYLASAEVQKKLVESNTATLPANPAANEAISDPTLKTVLEYSQGAPYIQTYFDQAFPTSVGQALNDAIANAFAGEGSPESIVEAVAQAAENE